MLLDSTYTGPTLPWSAQPRSNAWEWHPESTGFARREAGHSLAQVSFAACAGNKRQVVQKGNLYALK